MPDFRSIVLWRQLLLAAGLVSCLPVLFQAYLCLPLHQTTWDTITVCDYSNHLYRFQLDCITRTVTWIISLFPIGLNTLLIRLPESFHRLQLDWVRYSHDYLNHFFVSNWIALLTRVPESFHDLQLGWITHTSSWIIASLHTFTWIISSFTIGLHYSHDDLNHFIVSTCIALAAR